MCFARNRFASRKTNCGPLCLLISESALTDRPRLMVGFNRRFAPMAARMKSFLSPITEPLALHYRINAGYLPPDHWVNDREQGGGRIVGEVCHFVDLLMFLAASPIVEVDARAVGNSARYSGSNVLISLRFANGSEGTISYLANGDRSFSKERIEVFGGGSTAVLEDFRRLELVRAGKKQTNIPVGVRTKAIQPNGLLLLRPSSKAPNCRFRSRTSCAPRSRLSASSNRLATGERRAVDTAAFLDAAQRNAGHEAQLERHSERMTRHHDPHPGETQLVHADSGPKHVSRRRLRGDRATMAK